MTITEKELHNFKKKERLYFHTILNNDIKKRQKIKKELEMKGYILNHGKFIRADYIIDSIVKQRDKTGLLLQ